MKKVFPILVPLLLLLSSCGTFKIEIYKTPTPLVPIVSIPDTHTAADASDPLGMVYFWLSRPADNPVDPTERIIRIGRLPGSCIVESADCPAIEEIETPFKIFDTGPTPFVSWSPDGTRAIIPGASGAADSPTKLYVYEPQKNSWSELTQFNFVDSVNWSPDGKWIAIRAQDGLGNVDVFVIHPDGRNLRNLTDTNLPDQGEPSFLTFQGWLNGNAIIGTRGVSDTASPAFYFVDPRTGKVKNTIRSFTYAIFASPENALVTIKSTSTSASSLDFIDDHGTTIYSILGLKDSWVTSVNWSRDHEKISYLITPNSWDTMAHTIMISDKDGMHLTQYPTDKMITSLQFSPDGKYLLACDTNSLYTLNLETSQFTRFAHIPETWFVLYSAWQPVLTIH